MPLYNYTLLFVALLFEVVRNDELIAFHLYINILIIMRITFFLSLLCSSEQRYIIIRNSFQGNHTDITHLIMDVFAITLIVFMIIMCYHLRR